MKTARGNTAKQQNLPQDAKETHGHTGTIGFTLKHGNPGNFEPPKQKNTNREDTNREETDNPPAHTGF